MKSTAIHRVPPALKWLIAGAALAAATGVAFAAWLNQGAGIFMVMVERGLSWCF